VVVEK
jgi:hypothetical protein